MKTLLAAAAVALLAPTPPFPPPRLAGATPDMRCDWGVITMGAAPPNPRTGAKPDGTQLTMKTDAGDLELTIGAGVKIAAADGKSLSLSDLRAGQKVRAYYVVD